MPGRAVRRFGPFPIPGASCCHGQKVTTTPGRSVNLSDTKPRGAPAYAITLLTVGMLVVTLCLLTAVLGEQRSLDILVDELRAASTVSCTERRQLVTTANRQWNALAQVERTNRFIDDELRDQRLKIYAGAIMPTPPCTKFS